MRPWSPIISAPGETYPNTRNSGLRSANSHAHGHRRFCLANGGFKPLAPITVCKSPHEVALDNFRIDGHATNEAQVVCKAAPKPGIKMNPARTSGNIARTWRRPAGADF
jgi:hypothetical protein